MGLFVRRKEVLDFTRRLPSEVKNGVASSGGIFADDAGRSSAGSEPLGENFSIFGSVDPSQTLSQNSSDANYSDSSNDSDEKKRRFAKRIADMTDKIEELSNQIYHLQQRVEVLERKISYTRETQ